VQITDSGRAFAASLGFVEEAVKLVRNCQAKGLAVEEADRLLVGRVALALAGDPDPAPSLQDVREFCDTHRKEINSVIDRCLEMLVARKL